MSQSLIVHDCEKVSIRLWLNFDEIFLKKLMRNLISSGDNNIGNETGNLPALLGDYSQRRKLMQASSEYYNFWDENSANQNVYEKYVDSYHSDCKTT